MVAVDVNTRSLKRRVDFIARVIRFTADLGAADIFRQIEPKGALETDAVARGRKLSPLERLGEHKFEIAIVAGIVFKYDFIVAVVRNEAQVLFCGVNKDLTVEHAVCVPVIFQRIISIIANAAEIPNLEKRLKRLGLNEVLLRLVKTTLCILAQLDPVKRNLLHIAFKDRRIRIVVFKRIGPTRIILCLNKNFDCRMIFFDEVFGSLIALGICVSAEFNQLRNISVKIKIPITGIQIIRRGRQNLVAFRCVNRECHGAQHGAHGQRHQHRKKNGQCFFHRFHNNPPQNCFCLYFVCSGRTMDVSVQSLLLLPELQN